MDLSMILSPALEDDGAAPPPPVPPQRGPSRKWSADELQCAVAILQDFQQPSAESPAASPRDVRGRGGDARYFAKQRAREHGGAVDADVKPEIPRSDDEVQAAAGREDGKENNEQQQQQPSSSCSAAVAGGDDLMSKLDLLVQADAMIKRRRPKAPSSSSPVGDKPQKYLRSGIWSRAEEEHAAALVSYFLEGLLDLPEGMTLRKFLAEKLCCNRRRVSMKLGTESLAGQKIPRKVGASVFVAAQPPPSLEVREEVERVLAQLRDASFSSGILNSHYADHGDDGRSHRKLFKHDDDDDDSYAYLQKSSAYDRKRKGTRKGLKPKRGKPTIIRTGFESPEEEELVSTLVEFFMAGMLDLPQGTRLVTYLCQQLVCSPKQLSMKLAPQRMGEHKFPDNVGSITFQRNDGSDGSDDEDFSEELFEVESRLTELRLAREEAHKNVPPPVATPVKSERKSSVASVSSTGTLSVASTPSASPVRYFRRSGPWSHDEEVFAAALIDCFFKGILDIAEGTTLRAFLSARLCCNPMRVSKKLASESIAEIRIPKKLGSSTYVRHGGVTMEEHLEAEEALQKLQDRYMHSSTTKGRRVLGSKRPRQSRVRRPLVSAIETDSDTELDSDEHSGASNRAMSPEKLQKTAKSHSPALEARRQEFPPHTAPELVVPEPLKQQLA
ncbi:hypothetical protein PF005_g13893 [Phytophthora fragariae]|uniref:Uncharacterized protein n=1 Tax=Phytophthora fragariae TaxID=53985 RepID=A0A6A3YK69_9STRA|nr:hypothetical protein PF003_g37971 [Phytophthora fragariae]KAE8934280.1 hypothetical protein PF009_g15743 [Phytophthora fragariae]KAE8997498.1 hypothetical protein PF011_g15463 [Phytophthora fragariae]KAE9097407.1 hypothetical protein PF010_g15978 [Phytophthora fragariae]KAE9103552.1 hypothetical protein PF007_g14373 [Phytophthora fragariae]